MFKIYYKTSLFFNAAALTFPNVCFRFSSSVFNNLERPTADKESFIKNILQRKWLIPHWSVETCLIPLLISGINLVRLQMHRSPMWGISNILFIECKLFLQVHICQTIVLTGRFSSESKSICQTWFLVFTTPFVSLFFISPF